MKIKTIILSTVAILTLSSVSYSQTATPTEAPGAVKQEKRAGKRAIKEGLGGEKRGHHRRGKMMMRGLRQLNLSDTQKAEFKALRETKMKSFQPQREEMRTLVGKKRDGIITAEESTRLKSLREEMKANGKRSHEEMLNLLTPEQKTQLEQMKTQKREKMKERRGNRELKKSVPQEN